jgi:hypothetical protein
VDLLTVSKTAVESFRVEDPGVNIIKLFSFIADDKAEEARAFAPGNKFQSSLTFAGNTRSLPKKEASGWCSYWVGSSLALKF